MGNLNNKFKLNYFDIRGRAEIIRLILAAADVQYVDHRVPQEQWPAVKPKTPLGQMPYLEFEDQVLPQSMTIARFLARETNLAGKNNVEQAKADAIVDTVVDTQNSFAQKVMSIQDPKAKDDASKKFFAEDVFKHLDNIEKLINMYGSNGYAVGSSLTWADLIVFELIFNFTKNNTSLLDKYPGIKKVKQSVEANQRVSNYIKNRKNTPF